MGRLYHHFKNKEEIFYACAEQCYQRLGEELQAHSETVIAEKPLEEKLHDYFAARLRFFEKNRYAGGVMFLVIQEPPKSMKQRLAQMRGQYLALEKDVLFSIVGEVPVRRGVSMNMMAQIFLVASNYVHMTFGYPNWDPLFSEKEMAEHVKKSLNIFDTIISIMLYGVFPRKEEGML